MKSVILLIAFAALSYAAVVDPCLTASYASGAVSKLTSLSASTFTGVNSNTSVNAALNAINGVVQGISSGFLQNIYVASSNNDFYMIKNCKNQEGANTFCGSTAQYLAYVRNTAVFGDNVRHVYRVVAGSPIDIASNFVGSESTEYIPTSRFWYTSPNGWSDIQTYLSGGSGRTYSSTFGTGLVAAADRTNKEFCGACASNSYAVAVTQAIAITDLSAYSAVTNTTSFSGIATILQSAMTAATTTAVNAFVGFSNGDTYLVKNCGLAENSQSTTQCSGRGWLFYARNQAISGNTNRAIYALSDSGVVGEKLSDGSAYDTVNRPFYITQNGWTAPYEFASTTSGSVTGYTYTSEINGGVVGTDRVSSESCKRAVATTCPNSNSASATFATVALAAYAVAATAAAAL